MHYYQFNIADYRKDTTHLSRIEHSIYRDLIDWYYLDEAPIPLDLTSVCRRLRIDSTDVERALNDVLTDFFERTENGYVQKRIEQEIIEFHAHIANASKAGKASAEARRIKAKERALNDRSTNHKPITNNQVIKPLSNPDGFDEFWSAYPKKVGKGEAKKLWAKLKVNGRLPSVLSAIAAQKSTAQWQKEGGQFIPLPATWLRQGRWDDEVQQVTPQWNMFAGAI